MTPLGRFPKPFVTGPNRIPCFNEALAEILEPGVRLRAERLYQQLDRLQPVRQEARRDTACGEPQAPCREITAADSFDRSDSRRLAGGVAANATQFPHQATAMGLQWFRHDDAGHRRWHRYRVWPNCDTRFDPTHDAREIFRDSQIALATALRCLPEESLYARQVSDDRHPHL